MTSLIKELEQRIKELINDWDYEEDDDVIQELRKVLTALKAASREFDDEIDKLKTEELMGQKFIIATRTDIKSIKDRCYG